MTTTGAEQLVRNPDAPKQATLLELLFDVVYVAALALVSMRLASNVSWAGIGETLVVLMAIWWTWAVTTVTTDFYNPQQPPIQAVIVSAMLGVVLMAASVPVAFSTRAPVFAGAYVSIHVVRGILLMTALRGNQVQVRAARFLFWFVISGFAWIAGAFVDTLLRGILWAIAIVIDFIAAGFRYPIPRRGRVPLAQYDRASEHVGERYEQVMILTLGDIVLVPTVRLSTSEFDLPRVFAFLVAFATALLLWQLYLHSAGAILTPGPARRSRRGPRVGPYTHFVIVAGVVATAAGSELVIGRPTGDTPLSWVGVIVGGAVLFVAGRTTFEFLLAGNLSRSRVGWLVVLLALVPVVRFLPPMFVTLVVGLVLLGLAVTDLLRGGRLPYRLNGRMFQTRGRAGR